MKKILVAIFIVAAIASSAPLLQFVRAQTVDLGVENVGLLPSNPFYFLKEWGRGLSKFFTGNAVRKAQLQLDILNEKAAEINKLEEISPDNIDAITHAIENYRSAADELKARLSSITPDSSNPNIDKLVNDLVERALKHEQLFEDLRERFTATASVAGRLNDAADGLAGALSAVPGRLDGADKFRERVESFVETVQQDQFRELRAAELIDRLENALTDQSKKHIAILKEDLLIGFSGRLQGLEISASTTAAASVDQLPGDRATILKLLDEIREISGNLDLKNALNFARQRVLQDAAENNEIGEAEANQAILDVQNLIAEVEQKIADLGSARASVRDLLDRAKFNLKQAGQFAQDENYAAAYGQATSAYATARTAWSQLVPTAFDQAQVLDSLKAYYDRLNDEAQKAGLTKETNPKIFSMLDSAEKQIVDLSRLIQSGARPETVATALKNIRFLLATIEELIHAAANPPAASVLKVESGAAAGEGVAPANAITASVTVVISATGFSPATISIKTGTRVNWFNKDIASHWPASDPHPLDNLLPDFNAQNGMKQGETYSYVFTKVGRWPYHDHLNPALTGVVEVTE